MELIIKKYGEMLAVLISIIICLGILIPMAGRMSETMKGQVSKMRDRAEISWEIEEVDNLK